MYSFFALLLLPLLYLIWYRLSNQKTVYGDLKKLKAPAVIFDFDGTICPSYHLFLDELNKLARSFGHRKIEDGERENLRDLSAEEVIAHLGISSWKLPFLIKKLRQKVQLELPHLQPIPGISEIIAELKARGISIGILTSNSELNVRTYLKRHNIDYFDFIFTGNNLFGKNRHLKLIFKKILFSKGSSIFFVGDEVRDMEAVRKTPMKGIAVTWGYNSKKKLESVAPDFLCTKIEELSTILNRI